MATTSAASAVASSSRWTSKEVLRYGAAGWAFFITENAVLSENRTWLIDQMGNETYHGVYGTISTLATASIGYSYYKLQQQQQSTTLSASKLFNAMPLVNRVLAGSLAALGLVLVSQTFPKLQIPVALVDQNTSSGNNSNSNSNNNELPSSTLDPQPAPAASSGYKLQVRCPFDFSDKHAATQDVRGLERVTRHPGLWSFGLVSAAQAMLQPIPALRVWWCGPLAVAWLGGMHQDSRFRRGMGGTLDPETDRQTSNVPFLALLSGQQGNVVESCVALSGEIKPLNALVAVGVAALWIASRGRIRP